MKKIAFILLGIALAFGAIWGWKMYHRIFGKVEAAKYILYIPTGAVYADVLQTLQRDSVLECIDDFDWLAQKMNYPSHVYAGRYEIGNDFSYHELILKLRSGKQDPLNLVLGKFRTKEEIAGRVGEKLEADSLALLQLLNDEYFLSKYHLDKEDVMAIFIPNTYEFFWNTSAEKFFDRMYSEFERFWNEDRERLARNNNLDPIKATTLASIVEEESQNVEERPLIAGVYLNRLKKNMKLQADPTVKYAVHDFGLRRILKVHTKFDSPYNTYLYNGLPPGPICTPSLNSINAVLQAVDHDYLFFCAKDDFSGRHTFSVTYKEHMANARKFQSALNKNGIK